MGSTNLFAIADLPLLPRSATFHDGVDGGFDEVVIHGNLQLHLAEQVHFIFVTAIEFGLSFCRPKPWQSSTVRRKTSLSSGGKRLSLLRSAGLNDGDDKFHDSL